MSEGVEPTRHRKCAYVHIRSAKTERVLETIAAATSPYHTCYSIFYKNCRYRYTALAVSLPRDDSSSTIPR